MSDIASRIYALPPKQRAAVVAFVALLELSVRDMMTDAAIDNISEDYYGHLFWNESNIEETRRIAQYAIHHYSASIEAGNVHHRGLLLMWQLRMADIEMARYLTTGEQTYRSTAIERFKRLEQILAGLSQTWPLTGALDHVQKYRTRLEAQKKNYDVAENGPWDSEDATGIGQYYRHSDFELIDFTP